MTDTETAILNFLKTHGPARPPTIFRQLGLKRSTAHDAIRRLHSAGRVIRTPGREGIVRLPAMPPEPRPPTYAPSPPDAEPGDGQMSVLDLAERLSEVRAEMSALKKEEAAILEELAER
jgi:sugar-specific transcriptional regulator TrmB